MSVKESRLWLREWRFTESIAIVCGLMLIGFMLQLSVGGFNFFLLAYPANIILSLVLASVSLILGVTTKRSAFSRWISGIHLSVSLIIALLVLTIIMGLTAQVANSADSRSALGFDMMTSSWSFVIIYSMTILTVGAVVVRRAKRFNLRRDLAFMLNHLGLWLLLVASGLGYADMERYIMHVMEGETEWRVYDKQNNVKELPIAIELFDFDMDVYPPKIAMIDRESGEIQPVGSQEFYQIDQTSPLGKINGWDIELIDYIHQAVRASDSTYKEVPMPGSTPAALVRATKGSEVREGWVCGGNRSQLYMTLPVSDDYCFVMTEPSPRMFSSDVKVYTEDWNSEREMIKVNSPMIVGDWTIYQYGYDNAAGRQSAYSSFELVYDRWVLYVYIGIALIMFGSFLMAWNGKKEKGVGYDVE